MSAAARPAGPAPTIPTLCGRSRRGRDRCSSNRTWVPEDRDEWNGCITDRDKDYDQLVTAATEPETGTDVDALRAVADGFEPSSS